MPSRVQGTLESRARFRDYVTNSWRATGYSRRGHIIPFAKHVDAYIDFPSISWVFVAYQYQPLDCPGRAAQLQLGSEKKGGAAPQQKDSGLGDVGEAPRWA